MGLTGQLLYCEKCRQMMDGSNFYLSNNVEKYPSGRMRLCKKCITMLVDNWDPETYLWILEEADVPYIPEEWNKILERAQSKGTKMSGMTVVGRYLSVMRLTQWKDYRWSDTEKIEQARRDKLDEAMEQQGLTQEQREGVHAERLAAPPKPEIPEMPEIPVEAEPIPDEYMDQLTEEDKTYLSLKWGKQYRAEEWIKLEQLYEDMMASYDIQSAGHKDTLKMICKTSLKANQLIDIGDELTMSPLNPLNCRNTLRAS